MLRFTPNGFGVRGQDIQLGWLPYAGLTIGACRVKSGRRLPKTLVIVCRRWQGPEFRRWRQPQHQEVLGLPNLTLLSTFQPLPDSPFPPPIPIPIPISPNHEQGTETGNVAMGESAHDTAT